jgi:hypothetical protein
LKVVLNTITHPKYINIENNIFLADNLKCFFFNSELFFYWNNHLKMHTFSNNICIYKCSIFRRAWIATVHSKCINDHILRSDIFLPKCPTNLSQHSLSLTIWSDIVVGRESGYLKIFFYISRGEHVKHFVIDAYL